MGSKLSPKFRFFPESTKSWLSVKINGEDRAKKIFGGRGVQITTDVERHLGASLRLDKYNDEYLASKVNEWVKEIGILLKIVKTQCFY